MEASTLLSSAETVMRAEWNERAKEDAHYYVAFGRRDQDDTEFLATGAALMRELERELKRIPHTERALEIGCGPGRLLRPMSRRFAEIHGVDVSDEMIALAKHALADTPNAHVHAIGGSDLALFPAEWFDFVYSYAVFQHIPSREVVFSYLHETARVLKPGGVAHLQINGLPKTSKAYTTWEGVRIGADEILAFARETGIQILALTGIDSQYMWTTFQKPAAAVELLPTEICRVRSASNAFSSEQAIPTTGRLACAALSVENLPVTADLNSLAGIIDGNPGRVCYIGPQGNNRLTQVNIFLPNTIRTGLVPAHLELHGKRLCENTRLRVIPPGPAVPRLTALTDAVNLLSHQRIESRLIKASIEEVDDITQFSATIDGHSAVDIETFRADPLPERWEINFRIPDIIAAGAHVLEIRLGARLLARMGIEVTL